MFRSKPPRQSPPVSLNDPSPLSDNIPTRPARTNHRLRAPWRRAKTNADIPSAPSPDSSSRRKTPNPSTPHSPTSPEPSPLCDPDNEPDPIASIISTKPDLPPARHSICADPSAAPSQFPAALQLDLVPQPASTSALDLAAPQPPNLNTLLSLSSPTSPTTPTPVARGNNTPPSSALPPTNRTNSRHINNNPTDSASDESFAIAPKTQPNLRSGPLKRISAMFKESDGRLEENLKSMKRRIVQVRRQPDHAPIRFQMGFRSRTGWEPIRAAKENQDCLIALVPWGPSSRFNFFAALDGHGRNGHQCAIFVAQRVIAYLRRMLQPLATRQAVADTLHRAVVYAERKLENVPDLDFSLSGSTGVFVLIHGCTLHCANVGDSRAVVGREEGKLRLRKSALAQNTGRRGANRSGSAGSTPGGHGNPLMGRYHPVAVSFDQKPSRSDEKARLLKAGARVDAWESVDVGDERAWLPTARIPGLAVSRSFGDTLMKPYGVSALPELYTLELCEDDRFIVMASDGVFEFISSQEVVQMVGRWRDRGSAQDAAEELVKVATDRWIDDDSVIDDISCVIVFMNVVAAEVTSPGQPVRIEPTMGYADATDSGSGGGGSENGANGAEMDTDGSMSSRSVSQTKSAPEGMRSSSSKKAETIGGSDTANGGGLRMGMLGRVSSVNRSEGDSETAVTKASDEDGEALEEDMKVNRVSVDGKNKLEEPLVEDMLFASLDDENLATT